MKRKVLALISQHPKLKDMSTIMEEEKEAFNERLGFIKKQYEDVIKAYDEKKKGRIQEVALYLKDEGLMDKDVVIDKNNHLDCDVAENSVTLCQHEEGDKGLGGLLSMLMGPRPL